MGLEGNDPVLQSDFKVEDVLTSEVIDGQVRLTIGDCDPVDGVVASWSKECPVIGIDGFYSVPLDYSVNGACQALTFNDGVVDTVIGTYDNRYMTNTGNLEAGDRAIITRGPAKVLVKEGTDSVTLHTEGSELPEDANTMMISLDGKSSTITLQVGKSLISMNDKEIKFMAGENATTMMVINEGGVQIDGAQFICATGGGCLGVIGPQAPPIKTAMSILLGPTGVAGQPSTNWTVAPA